jgi:hypothetical protein
MTLYVYFQAVIVICTFVMLDCVTSVYDIVCVLSGCDQYVPLSPITSNSTCHVYEFCTGVRCCSDLPVLSRSINSWLILDHCNYKLSVGFEKFSYNISLHTFRFGTEQIVNIKGVVRLRQDLYFILVLILMPPKTK